MRSLGGPPSDDGDDDDDEAIRDAVARGATKNVFGYAAMAQQDDGQIRVGPDLVRVGKPTGPDEVDLGAGAYLLSAAYAESLAKTGEPEATDQDEDGAEDEGRDEGEERIVATAGSRLAIELRVGKTEVFDALRILPALADESETMDVSITIAARAKSSFDQTWLRNAVREPLDEAGIKGRVEIVEDDAEGPVGGSS